MQKAQTALLSREGGKWWHDFPRRPTTEGSAPGTEVLLKHWHEEMNHLGIEKKIKIEKKKTSNLRLCR